MSRRFWIMTAYFAMCNAGLNLGLLTGNLLRGPTWAAVVFASYLCISVSIAWLSVERARHAS